MENKTSKHFPQYAAGQRICLISMGKDPRPMAPGSKGVIKSISDLGQGEAQLIVNWDADVSRSLFLILPHDKIEVIGGTK